MKPILTIWGEKLPDETESTEVAEPTAEEVLERLRYLVGKLTRGPTPSLFISFNAITNNGDKVEELLELMELLTPHEDYVE